MEHERDEKLLDRIANVTVKKMDCACEEGIPGSDFNPDTGRSWFIIFLRTTESTELTIDPIAAHIASVSCLQRIKAANKAETSHLLCSLANKPLTIHK